MMCLSPQSHVRTFLSSSPPQAPHPLPISPYCPSAQPEERVRVPPLWTVPLLDVSQWTTTPHACPDSSAWHVLRACPCVAAHGCASCLFHSQIICHCVGGLCLFLCPPADGSTSPVRARALAMAPWTFAHRAWHRDMFSLEVGVQSLGPMVTLCLGFEEPQTLSQIVCRACRRLLPHLLLLVLLLQLSWGVTDIFSESPLHTNVHNLNSGREVCSQAMLSVLCAPSIPFPARPVEGVSFLVRCRCRTILHFASPLVSTHSRGKIL